MQTEPSRPLRVGELIRRELSMLLRNEVKDPRISEIIIYDVVVSKDLSVARVFFSPMDIQQTADEMLVGLQSASGFLRTQLSKTINIRKVPELRFVLDKTEAQSEKIEQLIQQSLHNKR